MTNPNNWKPGTIAIHGGYRPENPNRACSAPIYMSNAFAFENARQAADVFALKEPGHIYTRIDNPTCDILEQRLAGITGGVAALSVASGQSAALLTTMALAKSGQNVVTGSNLYGGTFNLFKNTLSRAGIEFRFVDVNNLDEVRNAVDENTRFVFVESIANPSNFIPDFEPLAEIAHSNNIPFIVDNTVAPLIFDPFAYGADIALLSLTKYIGGHATAMGGAIVDSGKFDWKTSGKFPELAEPDPSYHGLIMTEAFGKAAFAIRCRVNLLRDMGPCLSPFNAFLLMQGMETLHLRMPRHCSNSMAVAKYLESHPQVAWVNYPGLESHPCYARAQKYMPAGAGGIVCFGLKGGREAGAKFCDAVKMLYLLTNIGDAKSLVVHPASTTHQQLNDEDLVTAGVPADLIRLSIGIEEPEDLIADIDQAIAAASI